jgi:magnesium chelatase subunit D
MQAVKSAALSLLTDAYQRRDTVALITFRNSSAQILLPATSSVQAAASRLQELPTGGRTPLAEGLLAAGELLRIQRLRDPRRRPLMLVVTDGRATSGDHAVQRSLVAARLIARTPTACIVVDCESGPVRLGLAVNLAAELGGRHIVLEQVTGDRLHAVAGALGSTSAPRRPARFDGGSVSLPRTRSVA